MPPRTYFELTTHAHDDSPKDLAAELKDLNDGADSVSGQGETKVLFDGRSKGHSAGIVMENDVGGFEDGHVCVQDGADKLEGEKLGAHGVGLEVALGFGA